MLSCWYFQKRKNKIKQQIHTIPHRYLPEFESERSKNKKIIVVFSTSSLKNASFVTERITNKPNARMVRYSMSTMLNYNNVRNCPNITNSVCRIYSLNHWNSADRLQFNWCVFVCIYTHIIRTFDVVIWCVCICWGSLFSLDRSYHIAHAYFILAQNYIFVLLHSLTNFDDGTFDWTTTINEITWMRSLLLPSSLWLVLISPIFDNSMWTY